MNAFDSIHLWRGKPVGITVGARFVSEAIVKACETIIKAVIETIIKLFTKPSRLL